MVSSGILATRGSATGNSDLVLTKPINVFPPLPANDRRALVVVPLAIIAIAFVPLLRARRIGNDQKYLARALDIARGTVLDYLTHLVLSAPRKL